MTDPIGTPEVRHPEPQAPTPSDGPEPAMSGDADVPSPLARRAGPIIAAVSLALTVGLVAWMAAAPTNVAGPLSGASFQVPGTLATPVSESGCLDLVDGRGGATALCVKGARQYGEVFFDADGRLLVGGENDLMVVDQTTGEVLERLSYEEAYGRIPEPPSVLGESPYADVEGSQVRDPTTGEVLLDVGGPIGYRLEQAVASPDGLWIVAVDPRQRIIVAASDGSAAPRVWSTLDSGGYVDLVRSILWSVGGPAANKAG